MLNSVVVSDIGLHSHGDNVNNLSVVKVHSYLRFRNKMSVRFHTTILCLSSVKKTCGLRFHNTTAVTAEFVVI